MSLPVLTRRSMRKSGPQSVTLRAFASMVGNVARVRLLGDRAVLRPLFISWEINSACNLRCPYCYLHDRTYGFADGGLSFEEMKRVLGRIRRATTDVMLLGGEPTNHPDWDDIVDYCCDTLGLRVRCITNGTRLEAHLRTTGRLALLVVSYDFLRERAYPGEMADMKRQLEHVASEYPDLTVLINFVLSAEDDVGWVIERFHEMTSGGYNVFVNVDRHFGGGRVDARIVAALKDIKRRSHRVHMTDVTLDWLADTTRPVPFCHPTLLPLLDPRARLIYPCCYYDEQSAGSLLDMDYATLLRRSVKRFGRFPYDKCAACTTTAYLDAAASIRAPADGVRHYHALYNR